MLIVRRKKKREIDGEERGGDLRRVVLFNSSCNLQSIWNPIRRASSLFNLVLRATRQETAPLG